MATRAIGVTSGLTGGRGEAHYGVNLFGKPARAINCDCERSNEPALLQTVFLRNDREVLAMLDRPDGWLREIGGARSGPAHFRPEDLVRAAYLRTVGRPPDEREAAVARRCLTEAAEPAAGMRDLLWALVNTKEFIVNR